MYYSFKCANTVNDLILVLLRCKQLYKYQLLLDNVKGIMVNVHSKNRLFWSEIHLNQIYFIFHIICQQILKLGCHLTEIHT